MKHYLQVFPVAWLAVCVLLFAPAFAFDQKTTVPDTLTNEQLHQLDSLENEMNVKPCCNGTLAACLKKTSSCELAVRLHAFMKWLVARKTESRIVTDEAYKRPRGCCHNNPGRHKR